MSVDANAEGGPPKAVIAEVDVAVEPKKEQQGSEQATRSQTESVPRAATPEAARPVEPVLEPISSSDIFRGVFAPRPLPTPLTPPTSDSYASSNTQNSPSPASAAPDSPTASGPVTEDELQHHLRNTYSPQPAPLPDLVSSNLDRPLHLRNIRLSPAPPTSRPAFLSALVKPFLQPLPDWVRQWARWVDPAPAGPPKTLQEVLQTTKELVAHLDKFGVYDMQRSGVRLQPVRGGDVDEVELVLALKERGRLFLKAGTEVGGGEGGGNVTARIRNALGGAETLELNASIGTKTKSAYQASFTTPVLASPLLNFSLQAFSFDRDNTAFASHREEARGGRAKLSAIAPWGTHDLTYEYIQREIAHLSPNASVSIRELAHPSTKSSISHTWTSDTRDDLWTGTSGRLLKLTNEYAGLPGSSRAAHFFKTVFQSHLSRELYAGSNIRFSLSSFTSSLLPLFPTAPSSSTSTPSQSAFSSSASATDHHPSTTPLPDRCFLGGPNSLRGFKVGGLGLRDGTDGLGGDLAWAMGLSVFSPIPKREDWGLRLHGFMNVGKVVRYKSDAGVFGNIERLYRNPNVSVGVGLMYRLEPIRIELNVAMPLVGRRGEGLSRGLGIGVGLEFL